MYADPFRKIFSCKVSLKFRRQCTSQLSRKNSERGCDLVTFRIGLWKKIAQWWLKLFSSKFPFLTVGLVLKEKIKMKTQNTMSTLYHSRGNSTQKRESHFSLVWVLEFSILSSFLGKVFASKNLFAALNCLTKMLHLQQSYEHFGFSMMQQFLSHLARIRSRQFSFIWLEKVFLPLKLLTAYLLEKSNHRKIMLT